ncbi:hypothetical protein SEMRO_484_G152210.1 [Seminavis robusta]|uniref:Uncharacterized protein n=1 Tax=Seminavis robusta TaxID=568900 RepID=A0A9N8HEP4_9STRA|nr:hypothetical protein SEMRO_484_G152210.1 [Seminavis robusta]|eukprot:Sro484_g152210.1 n/a (437) ;mRNA; r:16679-17989
MIQKRPTFTHPSARCDVYGKVKKLLLGCAIFGCLSFTRLDEYSPVVDVRRQDESSTEAAAGPTDEQKCVPLHLPHNLTFPSPMPPNATIALEPKLGAHRCDRDAVFAVAAGYKLPQIILFVETLIQTGYRGDIVLGINSGDFAELQDFFQYHQPQLIIYELPLHCRHRPRGPICQIHTLYRSNTTGEYLQDARRTRFAAMLRFELFWAWTTWYGPTSRILVSDARDVFFQTSPFDYSDEQIDTTELTTSTTLNVFQEDSLVRDSGANRNWLRNIYGAEIADPMLDLPVICSGTTMGGRIAMDMYLRAMVYQFDRTESTLFGGDQALHNYLIHSQQLNASSAISLSSSDGFTMRVISHPPGYGAVNTVGLTAMRKGPLKQIGVVDGQNRTLNQNGQLAPVVHMFDRDEGLRGIMQDQTDNLLAQWELTRNGAQQQRN